MKFTFIMMMICLGLAVVAILSNLWAQAIYSAVMAVFFQNYYLKEEK